MPNTKKNRASTTNKPAKFEVDGKGLKEPVVMTAKPVTAVEVEFGEKSGIITTRSLDIKTLEDALKHAKVDSKVWEVERFSVNSWEVTMGKKSTKTEKPETYTNFQVKVWLRRIMPTIMEQSIEKLLTRIESKSPTASKIVSAKTPHGRYMLEVSLFDAHFGLLAWGQETGENYDLKIAEARYEAAVTDLLQHRVGFKPELILFPVGNDFLHVNNPEGVTPMGKNVLDVEGRLAKVFETAERAVFNALEACRKIAPTKVIWIPGNHDPETSFYLCRVLKAQYHNNPNVTIDVSPSPRKYQHFGANLIGFTHGDEEKHDSLPTIMAVENRAIWGKVKHCEFHVGHLHKSKETRYLAGDTYGGIAVKTLPSLSGTDMWHYRKGYVKGNRVAESFVYEHDEGLVATFTSKDVREIQGD